MLRSTTLPPPAASAQGRCLEIVRHRQTKNFLALKAKIIHTDDLIGRFKQKVAECEMVKKQLKDALTRVQNLEQGMSGLRTELNLTHEDKKRLESALHDSEQRVECANSQLASFDVLVQQLTAQLDQMAENGSDVLKKERDSLRDEKNKWRQKYEKLKRKFTAYKGTQSPMKRDSSGIPYTHSSPVAPPTPQDHTPPYDESPPNCSPRFSPDSGLSVESPATPPVTPPATIRDVTHDLNQLPELDEMEDQGGQEANENSSVVIELTGNGGYPLIELTGDGGRTDGLCLEDEGGVGSEQSVRDDLLLSCSETSSDCSDLSLGSVDELADLLSTPATVKEQSVTTLALKSMPRLLPNDAALTVSQQNSHTLSTADFSVPPSRVTCEPTAGHSIQLSSVNSEPDGSHEPVVVPDRKRQRSPSMELSHSETALCSKRLCSSPTTDLLSPGLRQSEGESPATIFDLVLPDNVPQTPVIITHQDPTESACSHISTNSSQPIHSSSTSNCVPGVPVESSRLSPVCSPVPMGSSHLSPICNQVPVESSRPYTVCSPVPVESSRLYLSPVCSPIPVESSRLSPVCSPVPVESSRLSLSPVCSPVPVESSRLSLSPVCSPVPVEFSCSLAPIIHLDLVSAEADTASSDSDSDWSLLDLNHTLSPLPPSPLFRLSNLSPLPPSPPATHHATAANDLSPLPPSPCPHDPPVDSPLSPLPLSPHSHTLSPLPLTPKPIEVQMDTPPQPTVPRRLHEATPNSDHQEIGVLFEHDVSQQDQPVHVLPCTDHHPVSDHVPPAFEMRPSPQLHDDVPVPDHATIEDKEFTDGGQVGGDGEITDEGDLLEVQVVSEGGENVGEVEMSEGVLEEFAAEGDNVLKFEDTTDVDISDGETGSNTLQIVEDVESRKKKKVRKNSEAVEKNLVCHQVTVDEAPPFSVGYGCPPPPRQVSRREQRKSNSHMTPFDLLLSSLNSESPESIQTHAPRLTKATPPWLQSKSVKEPVPSTSGGPTAQSLRSSQPCETNLRAEDAPRPLRTDLATGQVEDRTPRNSPKDTQQFNYGATPQPHPQVVDGGTPQPRPQVVDGATPQPRPPPVHSGPAALSAMQQQLVVEMQCPLPLPVWLVVSMDRVQCCKEQKQAFVNSKKTKGKCPFKAIKRQHTQKTSDYVFLNLERLVGGSLHLSTVISMFSDVKNVSNLSDFLTAMLKFVRERYHPSIDHVVTLYHGLCSAVKANSQFKPMESSCPAALTRTDCQLVALMSVICRTNKNLAQLLQDTSKALYQAILSPKVKFHGLYALCRVLTSVCRLQNNLEMVQFLVYDLLRRPLQPRELNVLMGVASVWPAALGRHPGTTLIARNQLVPAAVERQAIRFTLEVVTVSIIGRFHKQEVYKDISHMVKNFGVLCNWNQHFTSDTVKQLTNILINALQTSSHVFIDSARPDMFPWRRPRPSGWTWTNDILIGAHLWPLLQKWRGQVDSVPEATVVCAIRLIGFVAEQGLSHNANSSSILKLQQVLLSFLTCTPSLSLPVQLASADSLLDLCPVGHCRAHEAVSAVSKWIQQMATSPPGLVLAHEFHQRLATYDS